MRSYLDISLWNHRNRVLRILNMITSDLALIAFALNLMSMPSCEEWATWNENRARNASIQALLHIDTIAPSTQAMSFYKGFVNRANLIKSKKEKIYE